MIWASASIEVHAFTCFLLYHFPRAPQKGGRGWRHRGLHTSRGTGGEDKAAKLKKET